MSSYARVSPFRDASNDSLSRLCCGRSRRMLFFGWVVCFVQKKIRKIGICFRVFVVFVKAWSHSFQVLRMPKRQKQKQRTMRAIPSGESFNGVRTPGYIFAFLSFRSFSPRCSKHVVFGGFYSMFF